MSWIPVAVLALALVALCAWLAVLLMRGRRARQRFQVLGEVAAVSERAGSLAETFEAICEILVPGIADFCVIDVIESGRVRRAAVRVAPGAAPEVERGLLAREPSVPPWMVEGDGEDSLAPRFIERMSEADLRRLAHDDGPDLEFLRGIGMRSAITVALQARGTVKGTLTLGVAWSHRRYRYEDARFAWILSGRVALALDNSGLFADLERVERARAEIAETLQHGLLPPPLPHLPGWSLAAMYRPAGAENEVGGDFYDAFRVSGGWMLVIGDVTGRGAKAASITALARYTLRTAAELTNDPQVALATLNRALLARGGTDLCSVAALALGEDPEQPLRIAVAGHPPPLLIDGGEVVEAAGSDPVLGAFADVDWKIEQSRFESGQQLVVVTDGIIEARGGRGRFGEERLRSELSGAGNPALVVQQLEGALHAFTDGAFDDDAAMLVVARSGDERLAAADAPPRPSPAAAVNDAYEALVGRLFNAFNRRDLVAIVALCAPGMEFIAVTGHEAGHEAPYRGPEGLREYLADVERIWEALLITPGTVERQKDRLLVIGRVYVRSRELGIRDMPVAWIWQVRDGFFVRGEVFADPAEAIARFGHALA
ncbi:MAG TPA: SpoIIE family protein phosphatase [Solirubrobacterales bacterium]|jgi:serine phosphatase RsbU (regulator of sigma subunit)/ketosteroid isomerase-like protein|nr:SpoIIE family protein phosphatase [Solirubrobacterales bacterium]